jgi:hypothetical protein
MAEDSSSHRLRWVLLLLLLGAAVWVIRSRRPVAAPAAPIAPVRPVRDVAAPALARPSAPAAAAAPTKAPAPAPNPLESPTTELPVVDAPGGRTARSRRAAVVEIPPSAAPAQADGSPPGPEYTIKAKSGSELFHGPGSPYFGRTRAEFWFRTAADARAAGFTEWTPRRRTSS